MIKTLALGLLTAAWITTVPAAESSPPARTSIRMFEATFESKKVYANPFLDVDVDVVFTRVDQPGRSGQRSWRVPAFWHGDNRWSVRFAPREPGEYRYRLQSTDRSNSDLNGRVGKITITAYAGPNDLLRHGMFRVSANRRYFEQEDGTPFYWLADTWYTGVSDRVPWEGFKQLVEDRKSKGFTAIHMAIMTCVNEEKAPSDPGFCNEGGCVWDEQFRSINPRYFDYADRRVQYLIEAGLAPVLFGAWNLELNEMGLEKMQKYWRYLIARYGAYPVFWVAGGEIHDPPPGDISEGRADIRSPGWTEVVRYIRKTDPYHHPVSAHESPPSLDTALQDETLTDFDLLQPSHWGWASIATEVAQLNLHYARTRMVKPLVVGEIGWETLGGEHLADFQRTAFWLAMLNGAAGFAYGNAITGESYNADKPLHRYIYSLLTWKEAMNFASTAELGYGARLLQGYPWQDFAPHPEWVTPRGTTLLEPQSKIGGFDIDLWAALIPPRPDAKTVDEAELPTGEWHKRHGNFHFPYAAGIPGEVRLVYIPARGFLPVPGYELTVLNLEEGVQYRAYYWEPTLGVKFDLGRVARPGFAALLRKDDFGGGQSGWKDVVDRSERRNGTLIARRSVLTVLPDVNEANAVAAVDMEANTDGALVLRYRDSNNYLAAVYSAEDRAIYVRDRREGVDGPPLGSTPVPAMTSTLRLTAEVRDGNAIVAVSDGKTTVTSPIVDINTTSAGAVGLMHRAEAKAQFFNHFELRASPVLVADGHLERKLYDAKGVYRGELNGPVWGEYARKKSILLNAYRPPNVPFPQDWILVLSRDK